MVFFIYQDVNSSGTWGGEGSGGDERNALILFFLNFDLFGRWIMARL